MSSRLMKRVFKGIATKVFRISISPGKCFHSDGYLRHTQRRQEHLASLGLNVAGSSVLEVGAGIGDHTSFFLDRGCRVLTTDVRPENLKILRARYPQLQPQCLDLDRLQEVAITRVFDVVYCYGLLYHLSNPAEAIEFMASRCAGLFLLETVVSFGDGETLPLCHEVAENPTQSASGEGCRPTRRWVFGQLRRHFEFVYMPMTQPWHEEFPIDWSSPPSGNGLIRAVFVASRHRIDNPLLLEGIPVQQRRH